MWARDPYVRKLPDFSGEASEALGVSWVWGLGFRVLGFGV